MYSARFVAAYQCSSPYISRLIIAFGQRHFKSIQRFSITIIHFVCACISVCVCVWVFAHNRRCIQIDWMQLSRWACIFIYYNLRKCSLSMFFCSCFSSFFKIENENVISLLYVDIRGFMANPMKLLLVPFLLILHIV